MQAYAKPKYTGTALPTGANTVTLFSTVTAYPGANYLQGHGVHRLSIWLQNDHTGTLKAYASEDRGVTWTRVEADVAVSASATNDENRYDYLVENYSDFKVDFTNGGTNQTTFNVRMALVDSRNLGA